MKKCLRCGGIAEIETEKGFLCSGCDSLRLSYLNNPYEEKDINDFWKEIKNNSIERGD